MLGGLELSWKWELIGALISLVGFIVVGILNPDEVAEISKKYSPINYITNNAPPIISIHGDADSAVPYEQSQILHEALDKLNIKNQLVTLEGGEHMGFTRNQFQFIYDNIFSFLGEIVE